MRMRMRMFTAGILAVALIASPSGKVVADPYDSAGSDVGPDQYCPDIPVGPIQQFNKNYHGGPLSVPVASSVYELAKIAADQFEICSQKMLASGSAAGKFHADLRGSHAALIAAFGLIEMGRNSDARKLLLHWRPICAHILVAPSASPTPRRRTRRPTLYAPPELYAAAKHFLDEFDQMLGPNWSPPPFIP